MYYRANFRLTFYNLKSDIGLNALSPEEKQQIWVPKLIFSNTENKLEYKEIQIVSKGFYNKLILVL